MKNCLKFLLVVGILGLFGVNLGYGADNLFEKTSSRFFGQLAIAAVAPNGKYVAEASKFGGKQLMKIQIQAQVETKGKTTTVLDTENGLLFQNMEDMEHYKSIKCMWSPYKMTFVLPYSNTEFEKQIDEIKKRTDVAVDTKRKIITSEVQAHIRERIRAVTFSLDGQYLASAGWFDRDALLQIEKDKTGKEVYVKPEYTPQDVPVKIWGVNVSKQRIFLSKVLRGQKDDVSYLAFSADGKRLASFGGKTIVWDVESGNIISEKDTTVKAYSMDLSPDGKILAVGEMNGKSIYIYSADTGEELKVLTEFDKKDINSIAFSPDGKFLASAGQLKKDKIIIIWNTSDWSSTMTEVWHKKNIVALSFSPDNKYLVSGDEKNNICIWDVGSGKPLEIFEKDVVGSFDSQIQFLKGGEIMYYDGKNIEIKRLKCKSVSKE